VADYDLITNDLLAAANALPLRVGLGPNAMPHDLPADAVLIDDALRPTSPGWQLQLARLLRQIELLQAAGPADSQRAAVTQPDAALLAHLDAVQQEALRTRSCTSFSTLSGLTLSDAVCSAKEIDRGCVVLLARAFERVFRERDLAPQTKVLIAPLQLPLMRAALLDRGFFLDRDHPARVLLNTVIDAVAGQSEHEADIALCRVIDTCTRTLLHSTGEPNALFAAMQTRLARWLDVRTRERNARLAPLVHEQARSEAQVFAGPRSSDASSAVSNWPTSTRRLPSFCAGPGGERWSGAAWHAMRTAMPGSARSKPPTPWSGACCPSPIRSNAAKCCAPCRPS